MHQINIMKTAFHYLVRVKVLRLKSPGRVDFLEYEDKFEQENPLEARKEAFRVYQEYLEAWLAANQVAYSSEEQARADLRNKGMAPLVKFGTREVDFTDAFGCGLGVFLVIDRPSADYIVENHEGDECLIHGFGGMGWADDPKSIMSALVHEYWYYMHYKYDTGDLKRVVSFYEYDIAQAEPGTILETLFNWSGFNKPYSAPFQENVFSRAENEILAQLMKSGECNQVEFKPSLLFNHKTGKGGISIKGIIAKTICAFLNTNGGILFIGISNKSEIQGLQYDYSLSAGKSPRDFFQLEFDQMLEHFLSLAVKSSVSGQFYQCGGKDLFLVTVLPSKHRPIFLNGQEGKEFYVRTELSSRHITDIEEIANYCIDTWTS